MTFNDFISTMAEVWSLPATVDAILGGLIVGMVIAQIARPADDSARRIAAIVAIAASLFVVVFWGGQIVDAFLRSDPNWPRALARAFLQLVYGLFTGVGFLCGVVLQRRD